MLRLAPAERVSALVEMITPGPGSWEKSPNTSWRRAWASPSSTLEAAANRDGSNLKNFPGTIRVLPTLVRQPRRRRIRCRALVFASKFAGHGAMDHWTVNGKSYPETASPTLTAGQRYRLSFINRSNNDHPAFAPPQFRIAALPGHPEIHGILKDTVLVEANTQVDVEFTADDPGPTLFHCHQQNHMDAGFMMLLRYA